MPISWKDCTTICDFISTHAHARQQGQHAALYSAFVHTIPLQGHWLGATRTNVQRCLPSVRQRMCKGHRHHASHRGHQHPVSHATCRARQDRRSAYRGMGDTKSATVGNTRGARGGGAQNRGKQGPLAIELLELSQQSPRLWLRSMSSRMLATIFSHASSVCILKVKERPPVQCSTNSCLRPEAASRISMCWMAE